ncbi:hypothetical protein HK098_000198 [Nowakowskiella sp. JEL0407]|nr:hypothetical protein HK098_000198 [Nowakowskiella sp. JEL0407]
MKSLEIFLDQECVEILDSSASFGISAPHRFPHLSGNVRLTTTKPLASIKDLSMEFTGTIYVDPPSHSFLLKKHKQPYDGEKIPAQLLPHPINNYNALAAVYPPYSKRKLYENRKTLWKNIHLSGQNPYHLLTDIFSSGDEDLAIAQNAEETLLLDRNSKTTDVEAADGQQTDLMPKVHPVVPNSSDGLPAGIHDFPFSLRLPASLPATLNSPRARIEYVLTVTLKRKGLSGDMLKRRKVIVVRMPSNHQPSSRYQLIPYVENILLDGEHTIKLNLQRPAYARSTDNDFDNDDLDVIENFHFNLQPQILMPQFVAEISEITCHLREWCRYGDTKELRNQEMHLLSKRSKSEERKKPTEKSMRRSSVITLKEQELEDLDNLPRVMECIDTDVVGVSDTCIFDNEPEVSKSPNLFQTARALESSDTSSGSHKTDFTADRTINNSSSDFQQPKASYVSSMLRPSQSFSSISKTPTLQNYSVPSIIRVYPTIQFNIPIQHLFVDVHEPELDIIHVLRIQLKVKVARALVIAPRISRTKSSSRELLESYSGQHKEFSESTGKLTPGTGVNSDEASETAKDAFRQIDFDIVIPVFSNYVHGHMIKVDAESPVPDESVMTAGESFFSGGWKSFRNRALSFSSQLSKSLPHPPSELSNSLNATENKPPSSNQTRRSWRFRSPSKRSKRGSMSQQNESSKSKDPPKKEIQSSTLRAKTSASLQSDTSVLSSTVGAFAQSNDFGRRSGSFSHGGNVVFISEKQLPSNSPCDSSYDEFEENEDDDNDDDTKLADYKMKMTRRSSIKEFNSPVDLSVLPSNLDNLDYSKLTFDELNALASRLVAESNPDSDLGE